MAESLGWTLLLTAPLVLGGWATASAWIDPSNGDHARRARWLITVFLSWLGLTLGMQGLGVLGGLGRPPLLAWSLVWGGLGLAVGWPNRRSTLWSNDPMAFLAKPTNTDRWDAPAWLALVGSVWALSHLATPSLLGPVKVVSDGPIYHLYFAARWWREGGLSLIPVVFGESAATYFPANGDLWFTWLMIAWEGDRLAKVGQVPFWGLAFLLTYDLCRLVGAGRSASMVATAFFATCVPLIVWSSEPNVDTIFVAGYLGAVAFGLRAMGFGAKPGDANGLGSPLPTRRTAPAMWSLAGLAAGLALGTKATAIVFVAPLAVLGLLVIVTQARGSRRDFDSASNSTDAKNHASRAVGYHVLLFVVSLLIPTLFWWVRNTLHGGHPLYPAQIALGPLTLPGWYNREAMRTSIYYIPFTSWQALADILILVFDARTLPVWLIGLILGPIAAFRGRSPGRTALVIGLILLGLLNIALYWGVIPYRTQQRFMLQGIALWCAPLALTLEGGGWRRWAAVAVLSLHLFTPQPWPFGTERWTAPGDYLAELRRSSNIPWDFTEYVPSVSPAVIGTPLPVVSLGSLMSAPRSDQANLAWFAASALTALGLTWGLWRWGRQPSPGRAAVAAVLALSFLGVQVASRFPWNQPPRLVFYPIFDFAPAWAAFERETAQRPHRVAYSGTNIPYYLLGPDLAHQVRYVGINRHDDWLPHDFHREAIARGQPTWPDTRPCWHRQEADPDAWLENLERHRIELLFVTRAAAEEGRLNPYDRDAFPIERTWADQRPDRFELLYSDRFVRLYRVKPSS